jgi:hypothetical protein
VWFQVLQSTDVTVSITIFISSVVAAIGVFQTEADYSSDRCYIIIIIIIIFAEAATA